MGSGQQHLQVKHNLNLVLPTLDKGMNDKKRRRHFLKLENFCRQIYGGIKQLIDDFRANSDNYTATEQKQIVTLLKEIHRKHNELLRIDSKIMKDLAHTVKISGLPETTVDKIANITINDLEK